MTQVTIVLTYDNQIEEVAAFDMEAQGNAAKAAQAYVEHRRAEMGIEDEDDLFEHHSFILTPDEPHSCDRFPLELFATVGKSVFPVVGAESLFQTA